jgi:uncharacterized protein (DUF1810 family)
MQSDPAGHFLQRFEEAQRPVYKSVCNELAAGQKTSHWMWYIFPQLRELGRSDTARHFGIASVAEARAYWLHPLLGKRLKQCTQLVLAVEGKSAHDIFGSPDDLKFRSCMTLFKLAAPEEPVFDQALQRFYSGRADENTLRLLV